jgi:hypothetical protein
LFRAYLDGRLAAPREQFIDFCVDMLMVRPATYVFTEEAGRPGS